jgi:type II restriction enzyme
MTSIHAQDSDPVRHLLARWRDDPGATYQSWFLWEERLKNFRSIRRGLQAVISEIEAGSFGTQYRGSSLETVVHSIAEQRQIFKGADHAFLWKRVKSRQRRLFDVQPLGSAGEMEFFRNCDETP